MKIICDSKEEYDRLNKTFRYLHDFCVEDKKGDMICLDQDHELVGLICHLYLEGSDFPNKKAFMEVKK